MKQLCDSRSFVVEFFNHDQRIEKSYNWITLKKKYNKSPSSPSDNKNGCQKSPDAFSFFKWPKPGLFQLIPILFTRQIQHIFDYKLLKCRWCLGLEPAELRRHPKILFSFQSFYETESEEESDSGDSDSSEDFCAAEKPVSKPVELKPCFVRLTRLEGSSESVPFKWIGDPKRTEKGRTYYDKVQLNQIISVGDFVSTSGDEICRVVQLFEHEFEYSGHLQVGPMP